MEQSRKFTLSTFSRANVSLCVSFDLYTFHWTILGYQHVPQLGTRPRQWPVFQDQYRVCLSSNVLYEPKLDSNIFFAKITAARVKPASVAPLCPPHLARAVSKLWQTRQISLHVGRTELIDKSFGVDGLLDNAFLVVLANGPRQLVVVHLRSILAFTPQLRYTHRVFDLKDSFVSVNPSNPVVMWLRVEQQFSQKLPQTDSSLVAAAATTWRRRPEVVHVWRHRWRRRPLRLALELLVVTSEEVDGWHVVRINVRPTVIRRPVLIDTVARQLQHLALDVGRSRLAWWWHHWWRSVPADGGQWHQGTMVECWLRVEPC